MVEKYREEKKVYILSLEKNYDWVPRQVVLWASKRKGVHKQHIEIIKTMYNRVWTSVESSYNTRSVFIVNIGLHEGLALSLYLFTLIFNEPAANVQENVQWCRQYNVD